MFLQRFTCCLPHSLGCLLPACHDRQFRHQIVFLLHTVQHIHASQMHMFSQIKCVVTKIYFNRFPKGGTSRRPLVFNLNLFRCVTLALYHLILSLKSIGGVLAITRMYIWTILVATKVAVFLLEPPWKWYFKCGRTEIE